MVAEEADESIGWLELLVSSKLLRAEDVEWKLREANELTAIFTASFRTATERHRRRQSHRRQTAENTNAR
jgi:hypothetical protein